jgi:iron-sulfur cluster assembly protein
LTPEATNLVEDILSRSGVPDGSGVRIVQAEPNPAGELAADKLGLVLAAGPDPTDQVIEEAGARIFVETGAVAEFVDDKELDAHQDEDQVRFMIRDQA